jgi:AmmeMemoRadiSam system protein A
LSVNPADYPQALRDNGACFVTLKRNGQLRGCVGSPRAYRPLVDDVADNGFAAAFRDTRFPKIKPEEKPELSLSVSVLSPPAPMTFAGETDLLKQIRPTVDGLIIEADGRRALFLPQVWESLPRPQDFVAHLKVKAGLARDHWSPGFRAWRFTSEAVASESLEHPEALWT